MVPFPAPTSPSSKLSPAFSMAAKTSFFPTARWPMRLILLSLHSPTTGFRLRISTPSFSHCSKVYSTRASCTRPTFRVLVRAMGVSRVPSSSTCKRPAVLPKPFQTKLAAGILSVKRFPGPGMITVTPVLFSPLSMVQWPTRTPSTSVILFRWPRGRLPTVIPYSLIRFWYICHLPLRRFRLFSSL